MCALAVCRQGMDNLWSGHWVRWYTCGIAIVILIKETRGRSKLSLPPSLTADFPPHSLKDDLLHLLIFKVSAPTASCEVKLGHSLNSLILPAQKA